MQQGQAGFWDLENRLKELSEQGDPLEDLSRTVDFELFRPVLRKAFKQKNPARGGRPGFDPLLKFRMLVLQALHGLSLEQTEYLVHDRLSWMGFCGLGPGDAVPDANTLWDFREALIRAKLLDGLFFRLDEAIENAGYLPMEGRIVDATLVQAPRQRNSDAEKQQIREGKKSDEIWPDKPAKSRQKDTDARWTVKQGKPGAPRRDGKPQTPLQIPVFGTKNHICIDRRHGLIRRQIVTAASAHDGARLREGLLDGDNLCSKVWADSAYRSAENERFMEEHGLKSEVHRKKPKGNAMPRNIARANGKRSKLRARVEHVFARQKGPMKLFVRTIGQARAEWTITMANMAYNMKRFVWLEGRNAPA